MKKKAIFIIVSSFIALFILLALSRIAHVGSEDPFGFGSFRGGKREKNELVTFEISLISFTIHIDDAKLEFTLPPEVNLEKGDLVWQGEIAPKTKHSLLIKVISPVDWEEWSSAIKGRVEFTYEGKKYWREKTWSSEGSEDSGWNGIKNWL